MANDNRNMTKEEWKAKYREQRIRHDPDMPRPAPRPVKPKGTCSVGYKPRSRVQLAVSSAIKCTLAVIIFLGIGGWLSEHKIDVVWLLKAGILVAVIGFVIAMFSKTGKLFG